MCLSEANGVPVRNPRDLRQATEDAFALELRFGPRARSGARAGSGAGTDTSIENKQ
eukprot:gene24658-8808_t